MPTFEIVIYRKAEDGWPVAGLLTRKDNLLPVRSEGLLTLHLDGLSHCQLPLEYGTFLGKALFHDDLRDAFTRALALSGEGGQPEELRVLLNIEDPDLRVLHWERLCAPFDNRWSFLSLRQETPFSLYLPSLTGRRFPPIGRRDLRALLLVAGPSDLAGEYPLDDFDIPATVQGVRAALGEMPCDVLASVADAQGAPNLNTLCERLTAGSYTLLHIVCHGQYRDDETRLYLPGDDGRPITATQLIERLNNLHQDRGLPYFAFLMTCESAKPDAENGFGGLGQRLVRELGLPAVLAMTGRVSIPTANALVLAFYTRLHEHGAPDQALGEALAGLMGRTDVTVPAVFSRLGGQALFSDTLDRPLTPTEIDGGLNDLIKLAGERAPFLLAHITRLAEKLRGVRFEEGLSAPALAERATALAEANQTCDEILDLSFNALAVGKPPPLYDTRCPFPGLAAFRTEDRAFFFGRDVLVKTLARRLEEHPFLAVLGSSGTGKSSIVLAGLLPALGDPPVASFTPGSEPLARLENALVNAPANMLVMVDQFEELFTLCPAKDEQQAFIKRLLGLVPTHRVILTLRADFLGECAPYPALKQAIQAHAEIIPPMTQSELRSAIEQQAGAVGLRFEAGLAETILSDVQAEPGAMPLLQHALLQLWQRRHGRWLRSSAYRAGGGVREAIAKTADGIYTALPEHSRERMRAIFLRLTRLDGGAQNSLAGVEHRDTRRRVALDDLVPAGSDRLATLDLVRRLADARLVMTNADALTGQEEVEVAHEALIRYWPRLRGWLDEDRAALRLAEGVNDAALEWEKASRDGSLLIHRAGRLEDARGLAVSKQYSFNQLEFDYLAACFDLQEKARVEKERQYRNRGRWLAFAVAAVFVMAGLAIFSWFQVRRAEQQANISLARQLAVQASDVMAKSIDQLPSAMLLSVESLKRYPESASNQVLGKGLAIHAAPISRMSHDDYITSVAFSPDGKWVISGSWDHTVRVWEAATGTEIARMTHDGSVDSVAFSPDGKWVVSGSGDGTARVWEAATGTEIARMIHDGFVDSVAFSPDGKWVISGSGDNTARVWEAATGTEIARMTHEHIVHSVAFSSDGKWVISGSDDDTARVWEAATGTEIARMTHDGSVNSVAFSPDGKWVVSGSDDGTARVWETATGTEIARMTHEDSAYSVAFSPDGKWVVSGGDRTARVWLWQPEDLIELACARLERNLTQAEWRQYLGDQVPYRQTCPNLPVGE
ncbi:MAG: CHAT domain-containing protein [Veillonellaceae bacterium]|nr:CHAT domain-containing protein [Veillonellaceae bacterium]